MSTCANCGAKLSCGCQKRTLPNGKSGCANCASKITNQEAKTENQIPLKKQIWGPNRYKNLNRFIKK